MFSDPQSITVAGVAKSLPRVSSGDFTGRFRGSDGAVEVVGGGDDPISGIVLHQIFKRRRKLYIVFDDQDLQHHPGLPYKQGQKSLCLKEMVRDHGPKANPLLKGLTPEGLSRATGRWIGPPDQLR